jgi:exodeoxyribonuclease VII small subunit
MSSPNDSTTASVAGLTYEQALTELEGIVAALESGDHALEAGLELYERGQALVRYCARLLDQAELKIKSLSGEEWVDLDRAENNE